MNSLIKAKGIGTLFFIVLLLVFFSINACGGGGGGETSTAPATTNPPRTPSISNFHFTPASGKFPTGYDNVQGSIDFVDGGGDIQKIYIMIVQNITSYGYGYPSGTWGFNLDVSNFPSPGVTSGTINFNFDFNKGINGGNWNINVFVEDSESNRSNQLTGVYNVYY